MNENRETKFDLWVSSERMDENNAFSWIIVYWIWLIGPKYGRLMMLARLANIDMTNTEKEKHWTWLTIQVKNS
jgi:hypothetical protein